MVPLASLKEVTAILSRFGGHVAINEQASAQSRARGPPLA
jgi:hypothetical protein